MLCMLRCVYKEKRWEAVVVTSAAATTVVVAAESETAAKASVSATTQITIED